MTVIPDSTNRIVLTRAMRDALNVKPGEPIEVSISPGAIFFTPAPMSAGKVIRKGKLKVYTGKIPNVDVEDAILKARRYTRL